MFKDPCIRLATEVSKVLIELANSIKNRRHCSPEILSDHLHKAFHDLNATIKSHPRLFIGSDAASAKKKPGKKKNSSSSSVALSSDKTDSSALVKLENKSSNSSDQSNKEASSERKTLRPQLSKIAINSLEFSEALPFAAFSSLLVETVAKLDHVIEEVEELGRLACFKEYRPGDDEIVITCEQPQLDITLNLPFQGVE